MFHECKNREKLVTQSEYQIVNASNCQLISFAVNRLGYLVLPKAFQKNASHPFGFFGSHHLTQASL
jgi:hypothetical protein